MAWPVGALLTPRLSWPDAEERALVGRFYVAVGLLYASAVVAPFEFAYLFLVLERPEWAVAPLGVAAGVALVAELPSGLLADAWSRKATVLLGAALAAGALAAVPMAVTLGGTVQLAAVCGVFALVGLGQTLMSGAQEAWVVDNLHAAGRPELVDVFFARSHAVGALGGAVAAAAAIGLLVAVPLGRGVFDLLWWTTALGMLAVAGFAATIPEHRVEGAVPSARGGLAVLFGTRPLLMLALAVVVASFSGAASDQAFVVSLLSRGLDAPGLGGLTLADNLLGVVGPLLGAWLARRVGATAVLAGGLVVAAVAVGGVLVGHGLPPLIAVYLLLALIDGVWDPVVLARLHGMIPSAHRATIGSALNQADGLATLLGLGALGQVLGRYSGELQALSGDLYDAFAGETAGLGPVPTGWGGVPVPDLVLLGFVLVGLAAVPLVVASRES